MMLVAAKSKILEKMGFWLRNRPLLGISPGEKQSTWTPDLLADSRRCASSVKKTLHSLESLSTAGRARSRASRQSGGIWNCLNMNFKVRGTEAQWRRLTSREFRGLRGSLAKT